MRRYAVLLLLASCAPVRMPHTPLPDAVATNLIEEKCSSCHSTDIIYDSVGSMMEWHAVVHRMVYHHKAKLLTHITDEEAMAIAHWLGTTQKADKEGVRIGYKPTGRPLP